jgi:hypothetical protein
MHLKNKPRISQQFLCQIMSESFHISAQEANWLAIWLAGVRFPVLA